MKMKVLIYIDQDGNEFYEGNKVTGVYTRSDYSRNNWTWLTGEYNTTEYSEIIAGTIFLEVYHGEVLIETGRRTLKPYQIKNLKRVVDED